MYMQTTFLHYVTSIEVTKKPFYSENIRYEQIKIIVQCNDGKDKTENEFILIPNDEGAITINVEDFTQEYLED